MHRFCSAVLKWKGGRFVLICKSRFDSSNPNFVSLNFFSERCSWDAGLQLEALYVFDAEQTVS